MPVNRTTSERIEQARARLATEDSVWVATASVEGVPHMVPLSLAWDGSRVLVVTRTDTPTVRNVASSGRARLALDSTADVVIMDADATAMPMSQADEAACSSYIEQAGWDPRAQSGAWSMLVCVPMRMQAWNSVSETGNRTIMRDGQWQAGR